MNKCLRTRPRILLSQFQVSPKHREDLNQVVYHSQSQLQRCYAAVQTDPPTPAPHNKTVDVGLAEKPDPKSVDCDYIGPPDAVSNLRPYVRHFGDNETELAKRLRLRRIEVEAWNMDFWTRHNKRFYEEKEDFIRLHKESSARDGSDDDGEISADRLSEFYKAFLDKNWRIHLMFNLSWYLKNFDILTLDAAVQIQNLVSRVRRRRRS
ncbi:hypothetical protein KR009_003477 [Drosophila setifemur]|nr:hypothetical protein KR009_003477 [Drosophila setifemur]